MLKVDNLFLNYILNTLKDKKYHRGVIQDGNDQIHFTYEKEIDEYFVTLLINSETFVSLTGMDSDLIIKAFFNKNLIKFSNIRPEKEEVMENKVNTLLSEFIK